MYSAEFWANWRSTHNWWELPPEPTQVTRDICLGGLIATKYRNNFPHYLVSDGS